VIRVILITFYAFAIRYNKGSKGLKGAYKLSRVILLIIKIFMGRWIIFPLNTGAKRQKNMGPPDFDGSRTCT